MSNGGLGKNKKSSKTGHLDDESKRNAIELMRCIEPGERECFLKVSLIEVVKVLIDDALILYYNNHLRKMSHLMQ